MISNITLNINKFTILYFPQIMTNDSRLLQIFKTKCSNYNKFKNYLQTDDKKTLILFANL